MLSFSMSRPSVAVAASSLLVAALAGGAAAKTVTLTMTSWGSATELAVMAKICQQFEKANPGIRVKYTPTAWTGDYGYLEKIVVAAAAGTPPDVFMVPYLSYPRLADAGILADLSGYLARERALLDDWTPTAMEAGKWKGKYYGLPSTTDAFWTLFNEKTFQEVGIPAPDRMWESGTWTLENMLLAGKKIQRPVANNAKKLDRVGIIQMGDWESVLPWIWSTGGKMLSDDGTKSLLNQKETVAGFQSFCDAFINRGAGAVAWQAPYFNSPFDFSKASARLGMCTWWQSIAGLFRAEKSPWTVNMVPMPLSASGEAISVAAVHEFSMSKAAKDKDAAWKLVKYLSGPEGSGALQRECLWLQSSRQTYPEYTRLLEKFGTAGIKYLPEGLERMRLANRSLAFDRIMPMIDQRLFLAYAKKADPAGALADAHKAVQAELDRKFKRK